MASHVYGTWQAMCVTHGMPCVIMHGHVETYKYGIEGGSKFSSWGSIKEKEEERKRERGERRREREERKGEMEEKKRKGKMKREEERGGREEKERGKERGKERSVAQ